MLWTFSAIVAISEPPTPTPIEHLKLVDIASVLLLDPSLYRHLVGLLIYLTITQPDIVFPINLLNQFMHVPRHHTMMLSSSFYATSNRHLVKVFLILLIIFCKFQPTLTQIGLVVLPLVVPLLVSAFIVALRELEERARGCYAECFSLDTDEFAEMMLLDGCFIVELFRKYAVKNLRDKCDPIFQTNWMLNGLTRDLLLFENQLPFFVLTKLFEMTKVPTETHGIIDLVLHFFRGILPPWSLYFGQSSYDSFQNVEQILSLIHRNVCSSGFVKIEMPGNEVLKEKDSTSMPCATKLQEAGVQFKNLEGTNSLFDIKFNKGIMEIPQLKISDWTETFFRNLIAFEQYNPDRHLRVSDYVIFMEYLINSSKDVELLRQRGIIYNCLGDDDIVSTMFNKLGDYVIVPKIFYAEIYSNVNKHCRKRRNIWMAKLRRDYFHSPWALLSFLAAVLLLLLSLAQTIFSILSYISQKGMNV